MSSDPPKPPVQQFRSSKSWFPKSSLSPSHILHSYVQCDIKAIFLTFIIQSIQYPVFCFRLGLDNKQDLSYILLFCFEDLMWAPWPSRPAAQALNKWATARNKRVRITPDTWNTNTLQIQILCRHNHGKRDIDEDLFVNLNHQSKPWCIVRRGDNT